MATMAASSVFVDTNVLVFAHIETAPLHLRALATLANNHESGQQLWISRQIIREFLAVVSRPQKFLNPKTPEQLTRFVRIFQDTLHIAEDGPEVMERLLDLLNEVPVGGRQIHDANIVATMVANNIPTLLTHTVRDFRRFSGYITVHPLEESDLSIQ